LAVEVVPSAEGLLCVFEYSTELFESATISRFGLHFHTLLESIIAQPESKISQLRLLSQLERQQIVVDWNRTQQDFPQSSCMHSYFETFAESTPKALCLADCRGEVTYEKLNQQANKLAHWLIDRGSGFNRIIAVCIDRSILNVLALLGVWKAGSA